MNLIKNNDNPLNKLDYFERKYSKVEHYSFLGKIIRLNSKNDFYADFGFKSEAKIEKWYSNLMNFENLINNQRKFLFYVSRFSNKKGKTELNQERYIYNNYLLKLKDSFLNRKSIKGSIFSKRSGGFEIKFFEHKIGDKVKFFLGFLPKSNTHNIILNEEKELNLIINEFDPKKKNIIFDVEN